MQGQSRIAFGLQDYERRACKLQTQGTDWTEEKGWRHMVEEWACFSLEQTVAFDPEG